MQEKRGGGIGSHPPGRSYAVRKLPLEAGAEANAQGELVARDAGVPSVRGVTEVRVRVEGDRLRPVVVVEGSLPVEQVEDVRTQHEALGLGAAELERVIRVDVDL